MQPICPPADISGEAALSAAFEISHEIVSQIDLAQVARSAADGARRLTRAQDCSLCLLESEWQEQGGPATCAPRFEQPLPRGLSRRVLGAAQTTRALDCADCQFLRAHSASRCVAAPLRLGAETLGALCVACDPGAPFDRSEARAFRMLADASAVAVRNLRVLEAGRQQAARAERERMSAELHDHLAPTLSLINLKIEGLLETQPAASRRETADELARLKAALGVAYRQLRTTLSGLNEPQSGADDFVPVLELDLSRFQRESGIAVQLTGDAASALDLSPLAQSQALHIVRESLANVRRHAQARSVCVSVERASDEIRFVIRDDGRGFDHETVGAGNHLGLDIMRTRAARSGGELLVQSAPGCGTGVVARFPLAPLEGDLQ